MIYVLLCIGYTLLFYLDYFLWRKLITPFILTTFPIFFLIIFNEFIAIHFGFYSVTHGTFLWIITLGTVICAISSLFSRILTLTSYQKKQNTFIKNFKTNHNIFLYMIKTLVMATFIYIIILWIQGNSLNNIKIALGKGVLGHLVLLNILAITVIYGINEKLNLTNIILIIIAFIPLFIYGTRGWMLISMLSAIFLRGFIYNKWPNRYFIVLSPIFGCAFLFVSYLYKNIFSNVEANNIDILYHVLGYFVAGIQGGNALLDSNVNSLPYLEMIFSGIINIFLMISGSQQFVSNVAPNFFNVSTYDFSTNVSTALGTIYYGLGEIWGSLYIFLLYIVLNFLFIIKHKNFYLLVYTSILSAGIFLSFFEFYLGLIFFIETLVFLFLSLVIETLIKRLLNSS